MCSAPRFVKLSMNRDAHLCLTCGAKTTGFDEVTHERWYMHFKTITLEEAEQQYGRFGLRA